MKIAPHIIGGIEKLDKETIEYLKYKLEGLIDIYNDSDDVRIVISNIKLSDHFEKKISFLGSVDVIINEIKTMFKKIKFKPYSVSFDFLVSTKKYINQRIN